MSSNVASVNHHITLVFFLQNNVQPILHMVVGNWWIIKACMSVIRHLCTSLVTDHVHMKDAVFTHFMYIALSVTGIDCIIECQFVIQ